MPRCNRSEPEVALLVDRGDQTRRSGSSELSQSWSRTGALRDGLGAADAAERLWLLTSAELCLLATGGLGWSPDKYERWLVDLLDSELLETDAP